MTPKRAAISGYSAAKRRSSGNHIEGLGCRLGCTMCACRVNARELERIFSSLRVFPFLPLRVIVLRYVCLTPTFGLFSGKLAVRFEQ